MPLNSKINTKEMKREAGGESNNTKDKATRRQGGVDLRTVQLEWMFTNWDKWWQRQRRWMYLICLFPFYLTRFHFFLFKYTLCFWLTQSFFTLNNNIECSTNPSPHSHAFRIYKSCMANLIVKWGYTIEVIVKFLLLPFILRVTHQSYREFFPKYYTAPTKWVYPHTKLSLLPDYLQSRSL